MNLTLKYLTDEVILRSTNFGDSRTLDINTYKHKTRGGVLKYYKDTNWVDTEKFRYESIVNKDDVIDSLIAFLTLTAGLLITVTDHNAVERSGYIITPVADIITQKDACSYSIAFEFLLDIDNIEFYYIIAENDEKLLTEDSENLVTENYED